MQIVFEELNLPESGRVELTVQRSFEIKVTAAEAQRQVNRWLYMEVGMLLGADPPTLVIDQEVIWRVPVWFGVLRFGRLGVVGTVDVNVQTGEIYQLAERKVQIQQCASQLAQRLPPFQPIADVPEQYIPKHIPPAPKLVLAEE